MISTMIKHPNTSISQSAITLGIFDGVHRGHQKLIQSICEWKRAHVATHQSLQSKVISFDPHPVEVLKTGTIIKRLCSLEERRKLIENFGIDHIVVIPFTPQFAKTTARDFFEKTLVSEHHAAFIAIGENFYFGANKEGTPALLKKWCQEKGIECAIIPSIEADGSGISSTRIRHLLEEGNVTAAARLLGRNYALSSEVIHGEKRGRQLGFPTANLKLPTTGIGARCLPANGVYVSTATVEGRSFPAVTNVGTKPTIDEQNRLILIETHLLNFDEDLYGKQLTVEFCDRLRDEMKFPSIEALKEQIQKDTAFVISKLSKI